MDTGQAKPPPTGDGPRPADEQPSAPCWRPIGEHRYYVDDDLLMMELTGGEITLADIEQLFQALEAIQSRHGYYLLMGDSSRGITISAAVRRRVVEWATNYGPNPAMVCIGAGLPTRAVVTLAMHALRVFIGAPYRMEFFSNFEAGRSWLISQREELVQQRKIR